MSEEKKEENLPDIDPINDFEVMAERDAVELNSYDSTRDDTNDNNTDTDNK